MKRDRNPFDDLPNAWPDAIIFIGALVFLGYALWVIEPVFSLVWMLATW